MQTKSSYRVLKWTLLVGTAASLATACVVTSGDGVDSGFAGESSTGATTSTGGKSSTAGTTSTAGKTSTAGTASGGGGSSSTAGTSAVGGAGGDGYVPGLCDADAPNDPTGVAPTVLPSCAIVSPNDDGQDCKKCLKTKCCDAWQNCYGESPTTACGWGTTAAADGQWDCIVNCFGENKAGEADPVMLLQDCAGSCTNQCDAADGGNVLSVTNDLITCANKVDTCQSVCFPFQ